jgi:hypothetical protein
MVPSNRKFNQWIVDTQYDVQSFGPHLNVSYKDLFVAIERTKGYFFELEEQKKTLRDEGKRKKTKEQTTYIKILFVLLADKKRWRVYANGLSKQIDIYNSLAKVLDIESINAEEYSKFKDREWMFDVHWYFEKGDDRSKPLKPSKTKPAGDQFCPTEFPLAVECEWGGLRDIKYDFQKLLFCNGQLRFMIFRIKAEKVDRSIDRLHTYFIQSIESYGANEAGTMFIYAAFLTSPKKFQEQKVLYGVYQKQSPKAAGA